jgi:hypothetical protein
VPRPFGLSFLATKPVGSEAVPFLPAGIRGCGPGRSIRLDETILLVSVPACHLEAFAADRPPNSRFCNFSTLGAPRKVPFDPADPDSPAETFRRDQSICENRESPVRQIRVAIMRKVFSGKRRVKPGEWRNLILIDSLRPSEDGCAFRRVLTT